MKVLVWSPYGFGNTYWGPGNAARTLYSQRQQSITVLDVVSGVGPGNKHDQFIDNYYVLGSLGRSLFSQFLFILRSYFWIARFGIHYDIVHVLGSYEISLRPALWFKAKGCKVVVKLINSDSGFIAGGFLSSVLRLSDKRKKALLKFLLILLIGHRFNLPLN